MYPINISNIVTKACLLDYHSMDSSWANYMYYYFRGFIKSL